METMEKETSYKIVSYIGVTLPKMYKNMIYSKWMRSLRSGNDYFKLINSTAYYKSYNKYLDIVLHRPLTTVRIAILSDDPDVVLGFCVSENTAEDGDILHYCHTQEEVRCQGIAASLVNFKVKYITHLTRKGMRIWNSKLPKALFNPFL